MYWLAEVICYQGVYIKDLIGEALHWQAEEVWHQVACMCSRAAAELLTKVVNNA